jgi:phosphoglycerate dehydrogenase-like enzyme
MAAGSLVVTYELSPRSRAIIEEELGEAGRAVYLRDLDSDRRADALRRAGAVLAYNTAVELTAEELALIAGARLSQFTTAGIDWIPLNDLPSWLPIACNGSASAEPMAEHALAMTLAAAKRLFVEHANSSAANSTSAARTVCCGVRCAASSALAGSESRPRS